MDNDYYIMKKENPQKPLRAMMNALSQGGIIAAPTDTVYGLLADATSEKAIERVLEIKGRQAEKGMPIFVASLSDAKKIVYIDKKQEAFLSHVWPGKITAILSLKPSAPIAKNALKDGTIALRVPSHPLILTLLESYKKPLTGTSANRSGLPSCRDTACIREQLEELLPDLIVEGGMLATSEPSTIVDLTQEPFKILRDGAECLRVKTLL